MNFHVSVFWTLFSRSYGLEYINKLFVLNLHLIVSVYFQYLGSTLVKELTGTSSTIEGITKLKVGLHSLQGNAPNNNVVLVVNLLEQILNNACLYHIMCLFVLHSKAATLQSRLGLVVI